MYGFGNTGSGESAWVKPRAHLTTYNIDLSVYYVPGCVAARAYARSLRTATSVVSNYKLDAIVGSWVVGESNKWHGCVCAEHAAHPGIEDGGDRDSTSEAGTSGGRREEEGPSGHERR